ncbi:unnamed protein product [Caenorhabditis bovis]|uniref:Uncharacterized protein n=1 Tax=Caenorhabditis bovis TaxID=2654633 RepID=A0A8S1EB74_9PELO|nr:unnamed protein product [Caenorhabditis bovis]
MAFEVKKYSIYFNANVTDYLARVQVHLKLNEDVTSFSFKASKLLTIKTITVATAAHVYRERADYSLLDITDYTYDEDSETLTIPVQYFDPKSTAEGAYIEIEYQGVVMNEEVPPVYLQNEAFIKVDLTGGAQKLLPVITEVPVDVELTIVSDYRGGVEISNLVAGEHHDNGDGRFANVYVSEGPVSLDSLSFTINPPTPLILQ